MFNAQIVIRPCGCESLTFNARVYGLVEQLAEQRWSLPAILVEVEEQVREATWFRIPEQRGEYG